MSRAGNSHGSIPGSPRDLIGRIIALEIDTHVVEGAVIDHMIATFQVTRRWKGPKKLVRVGTCGTQQEICTCGVDFKLGASYLVVAQGTPLRTSSCDLTTEAQDADTLIRQFDQLK
jgi:hypothetical protein